MLVNRQLQKEKNMTEIIAKLEELNALRIYISKLNQELVEEGGTEFSTLFNKLELSIINRIIHECNSYLQTK